MSQMQANDSAGIISAIGAVNNIGNGQKTVTIAGTAEILASSTVTATISVKALSTNTGIIYIGDSGVSSTNGFELSSGDSIDIALSNLSIVYIDSSFSGEGVSYLYVV